MVIHWKGGILQAFWIEWLCATLMSIALMGFWLFQFESYDNVNEWRARTEILQHALAYVTSRFQAAMGLMLGFYTGTLYTRWWRVRNLENEVINGIKDSAIQVASLVHDAEPDIEGDQDEPVVDKRRGKELEAKKDDKKKDESFLTAAEVRATLLRWVNLAHALAVGEFYELQPNAFSDLEALIAKGLMTEKEYQCIADSPVRFDVPFVWFMDLVGEVIRMDNFTVSVPAIGILSGNMSRTRGALQNMQMYRSEPVPLAYRQLVNLTVRFYMIILAFNQGLDALEFASEERQGFDFYRTVFWMTTPFAFEYFLFVGWLTLADALGNPFRHWADEFEWENFVRSTYVASFSIIDESPEHTRLMADLKRAERRLSHTRQATLKRWEDGQLSESERTNQPKKTKSCYLRTRKALTGF